MRSPNVTGITDHAGGPASQQDRGVAGTLQPGQDQQRHQVTGMQGRSCRVEADVGHRGGGQFLAQGVDVGRLGDQPAPLQFVNNIDVVGAVGVVVHFGPSDHSIASSASRTGIPSCTG